MLTKIVEGLKHWWLVQVIIDEHALHFNFLINSLFSSVW